MQKQRATSSRLQSFLVMRFHYLRTLKSNEVVAPAPAQIDFYYEWVKNIKGVERKLEDTKVL
jgi:hypothetical protein